MASQITLLVGIIFSFKVTSTYSVIQYVISALITFVSAEVLEGKNSILQSKSKYSAAPWRPSKYHIAKIQASTSPSYQV